MLHKFNKLSPLMKKTEPKVILIRHGATDFNKESGTSDDRIRSWIDVPLNNQGRADAEKAAKSLKNEHPSVIYTSDLDRAKETADIINKHFNVPIIISSDLRPWNLGAYSGKKTADIIDELNDLVKNEKEVVPQGESFLHFKTRYLSKLEEVIKQAEEKHQTIFVVSHFRNLKCASAWVAAGMPDDLTIDKNEMITDTFKPGETYSLPLHKTTAIGVIIEKREIHK